MFTHDIKRRSLDGADVTPKSLIGDHAKLVDQDAAWATQVGLRRCHCDVKRHGAPARRERRDEMEAPARTVEFVDRQYERWPGEPLFVSDGSTGIAGSAKVH